MQAFFIEALFEAIQCRSQLAQLGCIQAPREGFKYSDSSCFEIFKQKAPVSNDIPASSRLFWSSRGAAF